MRAGLAVLIIVGTAIPRLARAQAEVDEAPAVPVHPRVTTILHLPDDVEHARFSAEVGGVMGSEIAGHLLIIQPRRGTPAGTEVLLQVWTATGRQYFWLHVTRRARDASRDFLVPAADTAPEPAPVLPAALMAPPTAVLPAVEEPARVPPAAPGPAPATPATAVDTERATTATGAPQFDITAHAVAGLGVNGLEVPGYRPISAWQAHQVFSLRLTAEPRGSSWSLQADVGVEWPYRSMLFERLENQLHVTGTRLRGELGIRAGIGTTWIPSLYAALGIEAYLRRALETTPMGVLARTETLARGGVLAFGLGLRHRTRSSSLGIDFQVRQAWPEDYFSMVALLTWGRLFEQGE
jgi:hypothetical protein